MTAELLLTAAVAWSAAVSVSPGPSGWAAAPIPGWVEMTTHGDLGRVRMLDGSAVEVPYVVVDPTTRPERRWAPVVPANPVRTSSGFAFDVDNPEGWPVDTLRFAIADEGEGVAEVTIRLGGDAVLVEGVRIGRLQKVEMLEVPLPRTDRSRLHVEVRTVVQGLEPRPEALRRMVVPATADDRRRVSFRAQAAPPSGIEDLWTAAASGAPVRISAVELTVAAPRVFRRQVVVEGWTRSAGGSDWREIGRGEVTRVTLADGSRGVHRSRLAVEAGAYQRLRLRVARGSEAPLELGAVRGVVARRWAMFPAPTAGGDLKLVRDDVWRSRTLEGVDMPLDPRSMARAEVGAREAGAATDDDQTTIWRPGWMDAAFILAAGLMALLAWRIFANARPAED